MTMCAETLRQYVYVSTIGVKVQIHILKNILKCQMDKLIGNIDHSKHYCHNEMSYFNYLGNVQNATHASRVCVTN